MPIEKTSQAINLTCDYCLEIQDRVPLTADVWSVIADAGWVFNREEMTCACPDCVYKQLFDEADFCVGEPVIQKLFSDDSGLYDTPGEVTGIDFKTRTIYVTLRADVPRSATFNLAGVRQDAQARLHKL